MPDLKSNSPASVVDQILHVDRDGGGNGTNLVAVKDGDNGTTFALELSTDKVRSKGDIEAVGKATADTMDIGDGDFVKVDLPVFYMGVSGINDEYLIIARYHETTHEMATGINGTLYLMRGGSGEANTLAMTQILVQDAYEDSKVKKFVTYGENYFQAIDKITVDGQSYLALKAKTTGGWVSGGRGVFVGMIANSANDTRLLTRVRASDADVTVEETNYRLPTSDPFNAGNFEPASGNGVKFSGGAVLDDYEEGEWTPSIYTYGGGAVNPTFTNAEFEGSYIKIGNLVQINASLAWDSIDSGQGQVGIDGLPYAVRGNGIMNASIGYDYSYQTVPAISSDVVNKVKIRTDSGYTGFKFGYLNEGSEQVQDLNLTKLNNIAGAIIKISATYITQ